MTESYEETRETSLRDFLAVLFRRKGVVLGVFLAAIAVVVILRLTSPVMYESTAQILLSRGQPESAYNPAAKVVLSWEEELNSEIETARSSHIVQMAQKILDESKLCDSKGIPIRVNPDLINTSTLSKSSVLYIRYRDPDPTAAQEGDRAITKAYTNFRLSVRAVPELEAYFRDEIDGVKEQLEDWEQRRADFMNEESVTKITDERTSLLTVRQGTDLDLSRLREDLADSQAKVELIQRMISLFDADSTAALFAFTETGTHETDSMNQIKQQLVQREADLIGARAQYQDDHPTVLALKEQVSQLKRLLRGEAENYLQQQEAKVEVLRAREESLLSTLSYVDSELSSFPSKEAKLASYDRVIDALRSDYGALVDKQIGARLERIGTSDWNVLVLQPASTPIAIRLNDMIRLALIPIIGLIVGMALAFLVDGLDHSVKDASEAEQHLGLPVLGSVGRLR